MKSTKLSLILLIFFILIGGFGLVVYAQEQRPMFDFGSMQQGKGMSAEPGEEINFSIYFYVDKEYGNRITHVALSPAYFPDGWKVEIDPPLKTIQLNVSGILTNSSENLYVEPREVLPQIPSQPEPGIEYLKSPSGKGYLQAKKAIIKIKIPSTAELGKSYKVRISASAFWFGQSGQIALRQTRNFDYEIFLAKKQYIEEIVSANPTEQKQSQTTSNFFGFDPLIIVGAILLVIIIILVWWKTKSKKNKTPAKSKKSKSRR